MLDLFSWDKDGHDGMLEHSFALASFCHKDANEDGKRTSREHTAASQITDDATSTGVDEPEDSDDTNTTGTPGTRKRSGLFSNSAALYPLVSVRVAVDAGNSRVV